jgi:predicted PurR-regulated permease PerM
MTTNNLVALLRKMADVAETARLHIPSGIAGYLPSTVEEWEAMASRQLRGHAAELRGAGESVARILVYILIGMVIGALTAFHDPASAEHRRPLSRALGDRAAMFRLSFRKVVFAQIRISLLNTSLTAIYLHLVLPSFGVDLPLKQTLIAVTFVAGLLPVIGNLISNTVIVMVSLSVSAYVAIASLAYLVAIHKLEYFVNARIIGGRINARAWEILIAMLAMDAWFGVAGAIAAPVFYAYIKEELQARHLI